MVKSSGVQRNGGGNRSGSESVLLRGTVDTDIEGLAAGLTCSIYTMVNESRGDESYATKSTKGNGRQRAK